SEYRPSVSTASDNNPTPWYFYQPANQWLVPVMSPSEGLIYKPYSGPSAPTSGFLAPFHASFTPFGIPPLAGNFMNAVYGVAAFHGSPSLDVPACASAITTNYFPTYENLAPAQLSGRDSRTRAIKVVPRNARSATESSATIFQSVQEERQQCGS
ncbi:unnamed protein product, partial [Musa textilis]